CSTGTSRRHARSGSPATPTWSPASARPGTCSTANRARWRWRVSWSRRTRPGWDSSSPTTRPGTPRSPLEHPTKPLAPLALPRGPRMSTITCQQPGCAGTVVDGYCDVCGMAPAAGTTVATAPPGLDKLDHQGAFNHRKVAADGAACTQPGCSGHILDGYCDVCGSPAGLDTLRHQGG